MSKELQKTQDTSFAKLRAARKQNIVIVADDDMGMRLLVRKCLETRAAVIELGNGNEVVAAYKEHAPDIVFLDIHMPGKNGVEVLNELQNIDPQAYVVMITADGGRENAWSTLEQGARGFVSKPFTKEKLLEHLDKCETITRGE